MPQSAMPEHINDPEEIEAAFPDDSQYGNGWFGRFYKWTHKKSKTWFAFSYRCTEPWAKWRKYPKVLFAIAGEGFWRFECDGSESCISTDGRWYILNEDFSPDYLSRIQYYTRWHIAIQWPLMVSIHFYPKASDVPVPGEPRPGSDGKVWYAYWNHFDADLVYWTFVSLFLGRTWK
jgi:hypothetical protein